MVAKQDGHATVASEPWHHEQRTWSGLASPPQLGHFSALGDSGLSIDSLSTNVEPGTGFAVCHIPFR
jgi:hypothetical protein